MRDVARWVVVSSLLLGLASCSKSDIAVAASNGLGLQVGLQTASTEVSFYKISPLPSTGPEAKSACTSLDAQVEVDGVPIDQTAHQIWHDPPIWPPCIGDDCQHGYCDPSSWQRALAEPPNDADELTVTVTADNDVWTMKVQHPYANRYLVPTSSLVGHGGDEVTFNPVPSTDVPLSYFLPTLNDAHVILMDGGMEHYPLRDGGFSTSGEWAAETAFGAGQLVVTIPPELMPGQYVLMTPAFGPGISVCDGPQQCQVTDFVGQDACTVFDQADGGCVADVAGLVMLTIE